jgi:hypothetical protein
VRGFELVRGWRRRAAACAAAAAAGLLAGGCAERPEETDLPAECRAGRDAVRSALAVAPRPVRVEGVPISACFVRAGEASDIAAIGTDYLAVASDLAQRARRRADGPAALRLGYLVGAMRRGARGTQGIHDEMIRRVEQELVVVDTTAPAFRRGERAGLASG